MSTTVAVLSKKGENVAKTALAMLGAVKLKKLESYGIASSSVIETKESLEAFEDQNVKSQTMIGFVSSRISENDKAQPLKLKDAIQVLQGEVYGVGKKSTCGVTAVKEMKLGHERVAKTFVKRIEGDWVFVIAESERIIAGRDIMGVRPLYYGENASFAALASERKAIWNIGIERTYSFPPGHIGLIDKHGFKFAPVRKLAFSIDRSIKRSTMQTAAKKLQTLLEKSVEERVYGLREVAMGFSGGLDSSIIAFLAKKSGTIVHLFHVSLENQPETLQAKETAEELELPIHSYRYTKKDIEKDIPNVLQLIEEPDSAKVSIGTPIYWAAEKAAEMNLMVMLSGQGADEIFGGYQRYADSYLRYGTKKVEEMIFNDVCEMYQKNFERDFKICNFHNVELRLPFASYRIAKFGIDLPVQVKLEPSPNTLRKLVLRQAAKNLGLPDFVVNRPKKAIQYATGVDKALKQIARKKRVSVREYVQETFQTTFKGTTLHN